MLKSAKWISRQGCHLLCVTILATQIQVAAWADQSQSLSNQIAARKAQHQNELDSYQKLKSAPKDFPDLPIFPGKTKFLNGYYLPSKNGASICQMSYLAQEDAKDVIAFYKNVFAGNGWKIEFAAGPTITARHKDGHICSVNVMESKLPKTKSQFTIAYRQLTK